MKNEFCPIKYYRLLKTMNRSLLPLTVWTLLFSVIALLLGIITLVLPESQARLENDSVLNSLYQITPVWNFLFMLVSQFIFCLLVFILITSEINLIPKGKTSAVTSRFVLQVILCQTADIVIFIWGFIDNLSRLSLLDNHTSYVYDFYLWGIVGAITILCVCFSLCQSIRAEISCSRLRSKYKKLLLLSSDEKFITSCTYGTPFDTGSVSYSQKTLTSGIDGQSEGNLAMINPYTSSMNSMTQEVSTKYTKDKQKLAAAVKTPKTPAPLPPKDKYSLARQREHQRQNEFFQKYSTLETPEHGTGSTVLRKNSFMEFSEDPSRKIISLQSAEPINMSTVTFCGCVCCNPNQQVEKKIAVKHVSPPSPLFKNIKAWSFFTFSWLSQIVHKASCRTVSVEDIQKLPWYLSSDMLTNEIETAWKKEVAEKNNNNNKKVSLIRVLFNLQKKQLLLSGLLKFSHDTIYQLGPVLLNFFITFITNCYRTLYSDTADQGNDPIGSLILQGLGIIILIICSNLTQTILLHQYFHIVLTTGMKYRVSVCGFVYLKSLRYSYGQKSRTPELDQKKSDEKSKQKKNNTKKKNVTSDTNKTASSTGEIVNLMSVDADRLLEAMPWFHLVWSAPYQIIFSLVVLYTQLGVATFVGVGVMFVSVPLATAVVTFMKEKFKVAMRIRDERLKMTQEVLNGIKIVKSYSWEEPYAKKIQDIRNNELHNYWIVSLYTIVQTTLWMCLPIVVSVAAFSVYVSLGNELTAPKAYTSMLAFQLLRFPLNSIPMAVGLYVQAYIACNRLQNFFLGDEMSTQAPVPAETMTEKTKPTVVASHLSLSWPNRAPLINNISFKSYPGTLTAIIGKTGVGKTGLISALVGTLAPERTTFDGEYVSELTVKGRVAYTAQTAWIQSLTLRDNILFGRPYKEDWYKTVVHACALEEDFKILPHGDLTEIGERGVNLSGGQKQRIALARAVYHSGPFPTDKSVSPEEYPADIFVLDDTLSAVDVHVANHIFEHCLKKLLCERNKTVILSTHKIDVLPQADQIIFLGKTKMNNTGTKESTEHQAAEVSSENVSKQNKSHNGNSKTGGNDDFGHESGSTVMGQNDTSKKQEDQIRSDNMVSGSPATTTSPPLFSEDESLVATTLAVGNYESVKNLPVFLEYVILEEIKAVETAEESSRIDAQSQRSPSFQAFSREQSFISADNNPGDMYVRSQLSSCHDKEEGAAANILQLFGQSTMEHTIDGSTTGVTGLPDNGSFVSNESVSVANATESTVVIQDKFASEKQYKHKKDLMSSSALSGTIQNKRSVVESPFRSSLTPVRPQKQGNLFQAEQVEEGSVSFKVYWAYFRGFGGLPMLLIILLFFLGTQALSLSANLWLSHWLENYTTISPISQGLATYGALGLGQMACAALSSALLLHSGIKTSNFLHSNLLKRILRAPMFFFDTTPLGRIITRFSKDLSTIDTSIPASFSGFLRTLFIVAETFTAISIALPLFLIIGVPLLGLYLIVQRRFLPCRRQLQRLNSVAKAPLYTHFQETLDGFSTIRAFRSQNRFSDMFEAKMNHETRSNFVNISLNRWLAVRLETIGTLIVGTASVFAFFAALSNQISASFAGLAITYALSVTQSLNWMVRMAGDLDSQVVSVERIEQYSLTTPVEAPLIMSRKRPPADWPSAGKVDFKNFTLRYRPDLPVVLDNLSLAINSGMKVGIIGRTGAGKSSIFTAVLRLVEASGGSIVIDGVNIRNIGLSDLRKNLAIIPQDPVLFVGSLRFNVDPFEQYSDSEIWLAFERVHLKSFVETELRGDLGFQIDEGGRNISLGQRQLICFARALLKSCKILLLDEATSSIDPATDRLIQQTIRSEFKNSTVITIAHRLETILDYDEIVVLDMGKVAEIGAPKKLYENDNIFRSLCTEANILL